MHNELKCPNCNAEYYSLRLAANVFLPFEVDENGRPYLLDLRGYTQEDIIENIEENGTEEYRCRRCGSVFKAIPKDDDDFTFKISNEI